MDMSTINAKVDERHLAPTYEFSNRLGCLKILKINLENTNIHELI